MSFLTSQTIQKYYDMFGKIEVTFSKEVTKAVGLNQDDVLLKIAGLQWPSILYSSSFENAKVIVSLKPEQFEKIKQEGSGGMLRLGFKVPEKTDSLTFFINIKVRGFNRYSSQRQDLYFLQLDYTQRPPEDYIAIIGQFLEVNINSKKRADERIAIREDVIKKIGFVSATCLVYMDKVPRKCIIRDLSFGGTQLLIPGLAKFMQSKPVILRLTRIDNGENVDLKGTVVRADELEGRKDIAIVGVQFNPADVPMSFKTMLNKYLNTHSKAN